MKWNKNILYCTLNGAHKINWDRNLIQTPTDRSRCFHRVAFVRSFFLPSSLCSFYVLVVFLCSSLHPRLKVIFMLAVAEIQIVSHKIRTDILNAKSGERSLFDTLLPSRSCDVFYRDWVCRFSVFRSLLVSYRHRRRITSCLNILILWMCVVLAWIAERIALFLMFDFYENKKTIRVFISCA